jgi:hypothetical protein
VRLSDRHARAAHALVLEDVCEHFFAQAFQQRERGLLDDGDDRCVNGRVIDRVGKRIAAPGA